ncbi:nucleoside-diphosphate sugar epimerase/dehydratase [Flavobacterium sp.]|uniref:polysaccharide biosynthesis protein n=1 Tax=Flavobacterium sp. TaxID=239 RepID=UPI003341B90A
MLHKIKSLINLKRIKFLPSWLILFIDIVIVTIVMLINFVVFKFIGVKFYDTLPAIYRYSIFLTVVVFYFLKFNTYTGVIRYSSMKDALRIFKAITFSFLTIVIIDLICYFIFGAHVFVLLIIFFCSLLILLTLITFRIFVKILFKYLSGTVEKEITEELVIIGVNSTTIALAEAFLSDTSLYNLAFFIEKNKYLNGKKVLGIPVIAKSNSIISILRFHKIKHIVLIKNFLPEKEELELLEECLKYNINVYNPKLESGFNSTINTVKSLKKYTIEELMFRETISIDNPSVIKTFSNKTVLVTGGAGSIGSEIVSQIAKLNPDRIVVLDQAETPLNSIQLSISASFPNIICEYELVDVTNKNELQSVFNKYNPKVVFHAAAYKHVPVLETNYMQAIKVNIFGTKNVMDLAFEHEVERFVFVSTDKAVNPTNVMGASKRIAEIMVQSRYNVQTDPVKTQIITTRFGNVLGSNGSVVNLFEKQIKEGGPITVTHPDINRFFMTIPEACKLLLEAATMGAGGEIYIFDMGKPIRIKDLAEKMIRLSGKKPYEEIDIVYTGLRPGEKLYEELLADTSKTLPTYHPKIMIAQDPAYCYEKVQTFLDKLNSNSYANKEELITVMMEMVPEFIQTSQELK